MLLRPLRRHIIKMKIKLGPKPNTRIRLRLRICFYSTLFGKSTYTKSKWKRRYSKNWYLLIRKSFCGKFQFLNRHSEFCLINHFLLVLGLEYHINRYNMYKCYYLMKTELVIKFHLTLRYRLTSRLLSYYFHPQDDRNT